ncbi:MAG TPA: BON domain-containing protein [Longimicrobium sp.]|nr:BON domain-containing protein [Longimicrobium sp.]
MGRSSRKDHDDREREGGNPFLVALGAAGGLVLGLLLTNAAQQEPVRQGAARIRDRAREAARGWGPAPLRRPEQEQHALVQLEDAVIDIFLRDPVLSERGVDVGCISPGIVELSGSVRTQDEAERAVRAARGVRGVATVVNRMDVEDEQRRPRPAAASAGTEEHMSGEWTGRMVGMGQRRQGIETENRGGLDDSQHLREVALEQSDRDQYEDEDIAHRNPVMGSRPGHGDPAAGLNYTEDELDNQDPYGKHAIPVAEQPQAMHSQARVGEGLMPGVELGLEGEDLPVKPHSDNWVASPNESGSTEG